jgi:hypothetical protein
MRIVHCGIVVLTLAGLLQAAASCSGTVEPVQPSFSVNLTIVGAGTVVSEPVGIDCTGPSECGTTRVSGGSVKLVAKPAAGALLVDWSVDGKSTGAATSVTLAAAANETRVVRVAFADAMVDAGIADARADLDGASGEGGRDAAATMGDPYLALCYSALMAGNLSRTLRFLADATVQGDAGRQLEMKLSPLRSTARTASRAEVVGAPLVFPQASLGPTGAFSHVLVMGTVDGAANPLSGRDITFQPFSQTGIFAPREFCTSFTSTIVNPIVQDFNGTCLYFSVPEGTPFTIAADGSSISIPSLSKTLTVPTFGCGP